MDVKYMHGANKLPVGLAGLLLVKDSSFTVTICTCKLQFAIRSGDMPQQGEPSGEFPPRRPQS